MTSQQTTPAFDPVRYKQTTRDQWELAAEAWERWSPTLQSWLGPPTGTMLDMARIGAGDRVLDIAAGAGEPAISAVRRVGPTGSVVATDISPTILEYALRAAEAQGISNIETQTMDGENLTLPDASFDAVLSRVGLIYFPDQQRALSEIKRVLVPGGRVAAMVYSTADKNRFFSAPIEVIRRRAQLPPPLLGQPGPFSLGFDGALEAAYRQAGFREIEVRVIEAPVRMASADEFVRFAGESFGAIHHMMAGLSEDERSDTWDEITREMQRFEGPEGFVGPCEMLVGVGVT